MTNFTNNFGKLIRRIQVEIISGISIHEIYEDLEREAHWSTDSIHEAIRLATEGLA